MNKCSQLKLLISGCVSVCLAAWFSPSHAICSGTIINGQYPDTPPPTALGNCTSLLDSGTGGIYSSTSCVGGPGNDHITCNLPTGCVMFGFGGNDTITGANGDNGNDIICSGSGDDRVFSGSSTNDVVSGGSGQDIISP